MNKNLLKAKIIEKGYTVETIADTVGINRATLYRKLNEFEKFSIGEALRLKKALCLTNQEACKIFLT